MKLEEISHSWKMSTHSNQNEQQLLLSSQITDVRLTFNVGKQTLFTSGSLFIVEQIANVKTQKTLWKPGIVYKLFYRRVPYFNSEDSLNLIFFSWTQDDPPKSNCLGIFGLSLYTTERDLKEFLEKYGTVNSCQLVYDHQVRVCFCYGGYVSGSHHAISETFFVFYEVRFKWKRENVKHKKFWNTFCCYYLF